MKLGIRGGIHAAHDSATWAHPLTDGLGSVRGYVDTNGEILSTVHYSEYGVPDAPITGPAFASENFSSLLAGDYILTDPIGFGGHGLLDIGWGPIEHCSNVFNTRRTVNNFEMAYTTLVLNIIPYVVDFTRLQSPTPRPFYCTLYLEEGFTNFARYD